MVTKGWGGGEWGVPVLMNTEFALRMIKNFWKWMVVMVIQHHECTQCHRSVHLKIVGMVRFIFTTI